MLRSKPLTENWPADYRTANETLQKARDHLVEMWSKPFHSVNFVA